MREIKFRAWEKRNKVMEYVHILRKITCFLPYQDINERIAYAELVSNDYILMQYTGLKDKNDKEIWEGDIIKTMGGDVGVVTWADSDTCFSIVGKNWSTNCILPNEEVLGNMYEIIEWDKL